MAQVRLRASLAPPTLEGRSLIAWGRSESGQLGGAYTGDLQKFPYPQGVVNINGVSQLCIGSNQLFVLRNDGTVWGCGASTFGALGLGNVKGQKSLVQIKQLTEGGRKVRAISNFNAGAFMALLTTGEVWGTGGNLNNALGIAEAPFAHWSFYPVETSQGNILTGVKQVYMAHLCAYYLLENGEVFASGQAYEGGEKQFAEPVAEMTSAALGSEILAVAGSHKFMIVLLADGTVRTKCNGNNKNGELGNGTITENTAVQKPSITGATAIAVAEYNTMVLKSDGSVWTWGKNGEGQIGNGSFGGVEPSPFKVPIEKITAIAAGGGETSGGVIGGQLSLALKDNGTVWGWGANEDGQLGDLTKFNRASPVPLVGGYTDIIAIGAAEGHCGAIRRSGKLSSPTMTVTSGSKELTVKWTHIEVEGIKDRVQSWKITWERVEGQPAKQKGTATIAASSTSYTITGLPLAAEEGTHPTNLIEVTIDANYTPSVVTSMTENIVIAEKVKLKWVNQNGPETEGNPVGGQPEPGLIVKWRRTETYLKAGKPTKEPLKESEELPEGTTTYEGELPRFEYELGKFLEGTVVEVKVAGQYESLFNHRVVEALPTGEGEESPRVLQPPTIALPEGVTYPKAGVTTFTAVHGTWTLGEGGGSPSEYKYQWKYKENNLSLGAEAARAVPTGGTASTYTPPSSNKVQEVKLNSSKILTEVSKELCEELFEGSEVIGTGIPSKSRIVVANPATGEVELNKAATKTEKRSLTFANFGYCLQVEETAVNAKGWAATKGSLSEPSRFIRA